MKKKRHIPALTVAEEKIAFLIWDREEMKCMELVRILASQSRQYVERSFGKFRKIIILLCTVCLVGCASREPKKNEGIERNGKALSSKESFQTEHPEETPMAEKRTAKKEVSRDWSKYFRDLKGAAVLYDVSREQYSIYHKKLALKRRSPCSTFKIISSLIGLEEGVISNKHSLRKWSGEIFWKDDWNKDIDFEEAFSTSCVWYFRQVIDELGKRTMKRELERLEYGNCDISDWKGKMNTNNNNRALTGFWIESSLKISAKEQVEVLARIFEKKVAYKPETLRLLKKAMAVHDQEDLKVSFYGKTGLGMDRGVVVDAWYAGFAEGAKGNVYFCVYLGRCEKEEVSSVKAKEIALRIVSDYFGE